ncbi:hypothetical protein GCM10018780_73510 [Streptomyces lanatus]|nr:hypothetical protein GCM10018780_73510 [Streptomyces lanatus]
MAIIRGLDPAAPAYLPFAPGNTHAPHPPPGPDTGRETRRPDHRGRPEAVSETACPLTATWQSACLPGAPRHWFCSLPSGSGEAMAWKDFRCPARVQLSDDRSPACRRGPSHWPAE